MQSVMGMVMGSLGRSWVSHVVCLTVGQEIGQLSKVNLCVEILMLHCHSPQRNWVCVYNIYVSAAKNENSNTKDELFHYPYRHFLCQSHPQESVGLA